MDLNELIGPSVLLTLFAAAIRLGAPIAIAAVGECFCERTGVYNLGLEGVMLMGAMSGFVIEFQTNSPTLGALASIIGGVVMGCIAAFMLVDLKIDQVVAGISVTILGGGLSAFLYNAATANSTAPSIDGFKVLRIPILGSLPGVGLVFFQQTVIVYFGFFMMAVVAWILKRSTFGLIVTAAGDHPDALNAAGRSVRLTRWSGVVLSCAMAGLAGGALVSGVGVFREYMTAGRGWVAISMVILARWNPIGSVFGGLLFGLFDALQLRVQAISGGVESSIPYEFFQALPYIATLFVVIVATIRNRRGGEPIFLGIPYIG